MSQNDEELRKVLNRYDDEPDLVVNRQSNPSVSIIPFIIILVGFYFLFNFYSENKSKFQQLAKSVSPKISYTKQSIPKLKQENQTDLHRLISSGEAEKFKEALRLNKKAIDDVINGLTPIMLAASTGNDEIIHFLLTSGADPNKRGSMQRTALQYAAEKNHINAAKRLLAYGADVNAYDNGRLTPLIMAANRGYTDLALLFIQNGADVDIQHVEGWTALIDATARNDVKLVKALLLAGADKDLKAKNGLKALDYARQYGFKKLEMILSK